MVSNDIFDIKVDRLERPTRPLPSGSIRKTNALLLTILMFSLGLILAVICQSFCSWNLIVTHYRYNIL